jgi:hypothetical protein
MSYGSFDGNGNAQVGTVSCFNQNNNAIGHKSNVDKSSVTFVWTAQSTTAGNITFVATVVQVKSIFWTQGVTFTVEQCNTTSSLITTASSSSSSSTTPHIHEHTNNTTTTAAAVTIISNCWSLAATVAAVVVTTALRG